MVNRRAFQDFFRDPCWACGTANEHGLQIKSYWAERDEVVVCEWEPQPYHCGPPNAINGGVIAAIMDCHAMWTATAWAYCNEGRGMDTLPEIFYVTKSMTIIFRRPTPMGPVKLVGYKPEVNGRASKVTCVLFAAGTERVRGEFVAVRVPVESVQS